MLHNLTIGHLDTMWVAERGIRVLKPLDDRIVRRHLKALGRREGKEWTLDGMPFTHKGGYVVCRWQGGPRRNLVAEEFALRMVRDTGCELIDREHGRVVDPGKLIGLPAVRRPFLAWARRALRAVGL